MPDILAACRDLKMDQVDHSYAAVIMAHRHQRAFDNYLAEPFLGAVARGAAACYEANRTQIEALDPAQQHYQRRELCRRWLVAVIKYTPGQFELYVRRAEFENAMEMRALNAITDSRGLSSVSAATAGQSAATEGSSSATTADQPSATGESSGVRAGQENSSGVAETTPAPLPFDDTEKLLRAGLSLGDIKAREKALADRWGPGWNHSVCARAAGVHRRTIENLIGGKNLRRSKWTQIVEVFKKRRAL